MPVRAAELAPVVREDGFDWQLALAMEWQHLVVEGCKRGVWLLGEMQEAEGVGAVGVHHRVQMDLALTF